jgi:hypothetical protein
MSVALITKGMISGFGGGGGDGSPYPLPIEDLELDVDFINNPFLEAEAAYEPTTPIAPSEVEEYFPTNLSTIEVKPEGIRAFPKPGNL